MFYQFKTMLLRLLWQNRQIVFLKTSPLFYTVTHISYNIRIQIFYIYFIKLIQYFGEYRVTDIINFDEELCPIWT